jgi:ATP-dependent DNA helicase RecG
MNDFLSTRIEFLKGVGSARAEVLKKESKIFTFNDLLNYFPFRYVDKSVFHTVIEVPELDSYVQLKGYITSVKEVSFGKQKRLTAKFKDDSGVIELVWFQGIKWILPNLKPNVLMVVFGKASLYGSSWNITHPEIAEVGGQHLIKGLQPIYYSGEKLGQLKLNAKGFEKLTAELVAQLPNRIPEFLPLETIQRFQLISCEHAYINVHHPKDEQILQKAIFRLKFEELLKLQFELLLRKRVTMQKTKGFVFKELGPIFHDFYTNYLPFELTGAQKRVVKEIRKDVLTGHHMNRLLQGDVGSGKTLVALLTMLMGIGEGFQAALMAPTEILAQQHYIGLTELVKDLPITLSLLTGSVKKSARKPIHAGLEDGSIHILIGTHALLEDVVKFKNLGLVVIDEQHRFGVAQRARLWKKNDTPPHILVMTATPIPRTLGMTFYGDLDVSVIDELPPGRKPIKTSHKFEVSRLHVLHFMKTEIALGRQVYVVYPLIEESATLDYQNLMTGYEAICAAFPLPEYKISIVHGRMKPEDKDFEMQRFVKGETQIMVATTVIEVGVNVPNASVMIIESAERFGLSQLHQLRGRVGRGAEKSYCILMTGIKLSKEAKTRMETMVRTNDGFEISEVDLQLRGPGDLMGTQQSGMLDLKISDLVKDGPIVSAARQEARSILEEDPSLELTKNTGIREKLIQILNSKTDWSKIS